MDRTVHAGECATCGQNLVQIREDGVSTRTYHPHTEREDCAAMHVDENDYVYADTTHNQYVPIGDDAPVPQVSS